MFFNTTDCPFHLFHTHSTQIVLEVTHNVLNNITQTMCQYQ